jgi:small redox-active disulfide protein 2
MKKLQILGSGCARCTSLANAAELAAKEIGLNYELEKVTDVRRFADFGVMFTPALVVDGEVKIAGKIPSNDEMKKLLA